MSLDHGQERLARQAAARGLPVREVARAIGADVEEVRRAWSRLTAREIFGAKSTLQPGEYAEGSASAWVPKLAVIPTRLTCAAVGKIVARYYMLPDAAMQSVRRPRSMARPRQVAFYLCRELTGASYPEIGRRFGGRDHTTVMHGDRATRARMETDGKLKADIDALTATIRAQYATHDSAADGFPQAGEGI